MENKRSQVDLGSCGVLYIGDKRLGAVTNFNVNPKKDALPTQCVLCRKRAGESRDGDPK